MKKLTSKRSFLAVLGMILAFLATQSCKKSSNNGPSPIGGYTSSDAVASANLVAYWPFDGNATETVSGTTATSSGVTYTSGIRGQAYQGSAHSYATLAPGASLKNLQSFSVSLWYKLPAQPVGGNPGGMFFLGSTTNPNEIILETENYSPASKDSVKIHHGFFNPGSNGYQGFTMESFDTMAIAKWVHLVMTYDGGSSTYLFYQNARPVGVNSAFSSGTYVTPTTIYTGALPIGSGSPPTALMGNLNFSSDQPSQIVIGTWPVGLYGVSSTLGGNGSYLGQMDELRVYNKALTQLEVSGLYLNGLAGR